MHRKDTHIKKASRRNLIVWSFWAFIPDIICIHAHDETLHKNRVVFNSLLLVPSASRLMVGEFMHYRFVRVHISLCSPRLSSFDQTDAITNRDKHLVAAWPLSAQQPKTYRPIYFTFTSPLHNLWTQLPQPTVGCVWSHRKTVRWHLKLSMQQMVYKPSWE